MIRLIFNSNKVIDLDIRLTLESKNRLKLLY